MNVKFLGIREESKTVGCRPCASKRVVNGKFSYSKVMYLPSGIKKAFVANQIYSDLSDSDAEFLLKFNYPNAGKYVHPFVKV